MPNQIDDTGIQTKTISELVASLETAFTTIYGSDINVDSNSPDGQLINNFALMLIDVCTLITQDYASKDPDQAVGVALDAVSQLCGITRNGGTYTQVNITVTTDRALNLEGQDGDSPFTISDGTNSFELITSDSLTTGANTLAFQAVDIGNVQISLNTLTTIETPVLGVLTTSNASAPTEQGTDQETDAAFRLRRSASVALPSLNALDGLRGALLTIDDVIDCLVIENTASTADSDSIPGHGIWVIVEGGDEDEIAEMIYLYRSQGVPMKGSENVDVTQADGSTLQMDFDYAVSEDLYVDLTISSKSGGSIDSDAIKEGIVSALTYGINDTADVSSIIAEVFSINPDAVVSSAGVYIYGGSSASTVDPSDKKNYFELTTDQIDITVT